MDQRQARLLEKELVKAIVEFVCRLVFVGFGYCPPIRPCKMARAAVAVYEPEVDMPKE
jgi:hypothetical protein